MSLSTAATRPSTKARSVKDKVSDGITQRKFRRSEHDEERDEQG